MKGNHNISGYFLPFAFLVVLALPFLNSQLNIWEFERKDENRTFADTLHFDITHLDAFPGDCETYINDNFSFRSPLLDLYHKSQYAWFKVSPYPKRLIVGRNGWFFQADKEIEIYRGEHDFTDEQIESFNEVWTYRKEYFDSLKVPFYWVIAPMKHHVYSEELPFNIFPAEKRRVDAIRDGLRFKEFMIDPVASMRQAKDSVQFYYRMDHHWNFHSGAFVSSLLGQQIEAEFPDQSFNALDYIEWADSTFRSGHHYKLLGNDELKELAQVPALSSLRSVEVEKFGFASPEGFPYPWEYEMRYENPQASSSLKALFIRDSFGEQMMPFAREMFSESLFIFDAWKYGLDKELIEEYDPDVVIYLTSEALIQNVIRD